MNYEMNYEMIAHVLNTCEPYNNIPKQFYFSEAKYQDVQPRYAKIDGSKNLCLSVGPDAF